MRLDAWQLGVDWKPSAPRFLLGTRYSQQIGSDNSVVIASHHRLAHNAETLPTEQSFLEAGLVILKPFSTHLWLVLLGSVFLSAFALYTVEWDQPDYESVETHAGGLALSLYYAMTALTGVGAHSPSTGTGRALLAALL